mmetsp:Transcript_42650/g.132719  ORF Transcript_42650/g.132719 Transcript_42650/m.132719 type:complete len:212 (+) Transcript_42650:112-747(+)
MAAGARAHDEAGRGAAPKRARGGEGRHRCAVLHPSGRGPREGAQRPAWVTRGGPPGRSAGAAGRARLRHAAVAGAAGRAARGPPHFRGGRGGHLRAAAAGDARSGRAAAVRARLQPRQDHGGVPRRASPEEALPHLWEPPAAGGAGRVRPVRHRPAARGRRPGLLSETAPRLRLQPPLSLFRGGRGRRGLGGVAGRGRGPVRPAGRRRALR